jgi:hypothetical protein
MPEWYRFHATRIGYIGNRIYSIPTLSGSVGQAAENNPADVALVQRLLNKAMDMGYIWQHGAHVAENGRINGPDYTIMLIRQFQLNQRLIKPGPQQRIIIHPNDKTLLRLIEAVNRTPAVGAGKSFSDCAHLAPVASWERERFNEDTVNMIVKATNATGVDPTLLAVTWQCESHFDIFPMSNLNRDFPPKNPKVPNWDVGPVQINYRTWHVAPLLKGLDNVFGSTIERCAAQGYIAKYPASAERFNGNALNNIIAGGRILRDYGGKPGVGMETRANAAGYYRTGKGSFLQQANGQREFKVRATLFKKSAAAWDKFFTAIGAK